MGLSRSRNGTRVFGWGSFRLPTPPRSDPASLAHSLSARHASAAPHIGQRGPPGSRRSAEPWRDPNVQPEASGPAEHRLTVVGGEMIWRAMSTSGQIGSEATSATTRARGQDLPDKDRRRGPVARQVAVGATCPRVHGGRGWRSPSRSWSHSFGRVRRAGSGAARPPRRQPLCSWPAAIRVRRSSPRSSAHSPTASTSGLITRPTSLLFDFELSEEGAGLTDAPPGNHGADAHTGFACSPPGRSRSGARDPEDPDWPDTPWSTLTVEDPEGLWAPASVAGLTTASSTTRRTPWSRAILSTSPGESVALNRATRRGRGLPGRASLRSPWSATSGWSWSSCTSPTGRSAPKSETTACAD